MGHLSSMYPWWNAAAATPNATVSVPDTVGPGATYSPGDPDGFEIVDDDVAPQHRSSALVPMPWDGWPAGWASPMWNQLGPKFDTLVDTAWAALDLNASVLSAMPVYRTRNGQVLPPTTWMANPDPSIYTDWSEFAKQLFWDYQMGEAFVLPMAHGADGWPYNFRVIPPPFIDVDMKNAGRVYHLGGSTGPDVTDDVLHIRYKSTSDGARGVGPLEAGKTRLVAAAVLARYATEVAQGAGVPRFIIEVPEKRTRDQARDLVETWWESRMANLDGPWKPGVLSGGAKAVPLQIDPEKMALTELAQINDARISTLLGVPPFLLGIPTGESMTYANVSQVFDFHDRRYLKTAAVRNMSALSGWVLPRGQSVELNRDEYSRPALKERAEANKILFEAGALSVEEWRVMERLMGPGVPELPDEDTVAAEALTGGGRS